jgi:glycosyltransferase involved in cell wall biosynthesis
LFYPHGSGAELATYLYARLLSEAKVNVVVVTNRFSGEPEFSCKEGFEIYRLPLFRTGSVKYSQWFNVLFTGFIRKLIKWADIVYIPRFWFSAIPLAKLYGKPVITHLHGYIPICPLTVLYNSEKDKVCEKEGACSSYCIYMFERRKRSFATAAFSTILNLAIWPFYRKFIECSDAIICVSKAQRDILIRHAPSLRAKARVIYNPIPQLSLVDMNGNDFGYFGGSSYFKGFFVLLKALNYIKSHDGKSIIVHGTKFFNPDEKRASLLKKLGLIIYGKLGSHEYDKVYRKIKAVIVPSIWHETFGYVVVEALMKGRLVIASRIGGIPEIVSGCKGVFLFTPNDFCQLAEKINYVNSLSREVVSDLGLHNREVFSSNFNNKKTINNFIKLCNDLSANRIS